MNSTIGLSPASAAPTPSPAKPCSVIGVSITRMRAEFLQQALGDLVGALIFGDLLAHHEDVLVAAHLLRHGVAQRFAHRHGHHLGAVRHVRLGQSVLRRAARRVSGGAGARLRPAAPAASAFAGGAGFGGLLRTSRRAAVLQRGGVLAFGQDHGDRRVDRDVVGAFRHQDLAERAFVDRLDLHGRLVGLDLGDDVAGLDRVALLLEPLGEVALLHRRRERGHQDFDRHGRFPVGGLAGDPREIGRHRHRRRRRPSGRRGRRPAPC